MSNRNSKLAAAVAAVTKTIIGAEIAKPAMVEMPKAVSELHVSPTEIIPQGTIITDEIADLAGLDADTIGELERKGAIVFVDVLASAVQSPSPTAA